MKDQKKAEDAVYCWTLWVSSNSNTHWQEIASNKENIIKIKGRVLWIELSVPTNFTNEVICSCDL